MLPYVETGTAWITPTFTSGTALNERVCLLLLIVGDIPSCTLLIATSSMTMRGVVWAFSSVLSWSWKVTTSPPLWVVWLAPPSSYVVLGLSPVLTSTPFDLIVTLFAFLVSLDKRGPFQSHSTIAVRGNTIILLFFLYSIFKPGQDLAQNLIQLWIIALRWIGNCSI